MATQSREAVNFSTGSPRTDYGHSVTVPSSNANTCAAASNSSASSKVSAKIASR
ncbi:hypothetical protein [Micromonospora saelicesensis]|uniref:hypothetical protein n=1 Tax=Micromonospora saelicesensis TaxID=285676 RepID=UPI0015EB7F8E|nr:hypothetical protein [Micromonospora saelicesensis]